MLHSVKEDIVYTCSRYCHWLDHYNSRFEADCNHTIFLNPLMFRMCFYRFFSRSIPHPSILLRPFFLNHSSLLSLSIASASSESPAGSTYQHVISLNARASLLSGPSLFTRVASDFQACSIGPHSA